MTITEEKALTRLPITNRYLGFQGDAQSGESCFNNTVHWRSSLPVQIVLHRQLVLLAGAEDVYPQVADGERLTRTNQVDVGGSTPLPVHDGDHARANCLLITD